jgi:hypothetical protein
MNVIFNVNFQINTQKIVANVVTLNANHSKIQQFYVKFCWQILNMNFMNHSKINK